MVNRAGLTGLLHRLQRIGGVSAFHGVQVVAGSSQGRRNGRVQHLAGPGLVFGWRDRGLVSEIAWRACGILCRFSGGVRLAYNRKPNESTPAEGTCLN